MIFKKNNLPSMYDEKKFKRARTRINILYLFGPLIILLVIFRFLNLFGWWQVTKLELTRQPSNKRASYTFLDFSNHKKAQEKLLESTQKTAGPAASIIVVSYFNLLQPGVFLIRNNEGLSLVDLGKVIVTTKSGLSTFTLYLSDCIEEKRKDSKDAARFGSSILSKLLGKKELPSEKKISFLLKSPEKSKYLKIPYLIYFYFPLLIILILSHFYSPAVLTAFFYYPALFLLFDFKNLFFTVPFQWLTRSLNIGIPDVMGGLAAVIVVLLFTLIGVAGISNWKKQRVILKEKLIIFFFLLLPLFLRF